jgi:hypothetical protein
VSTFLLCFGRSPCDYRGKSCGITRPDNTDNARSATATFPRYYSIGSASRGFYHQNPTLAGKWRRVEGKKSRRPEKEREREREREEKKVARRDKRAFTQCAIACPRRYFRRNFSYGRMNLSRDRLRKRERTSARDASALLHSGHSREARAAGESFASRSRNKRDYTELTA